MSEEKTVQQAPAPMLASSTGAIIGTTLEERYRVCSLYAKSGMLPKSYDTPEKVFAGIQYAIELGFQDRPLTALRNIAIINGQPSLWGELPLALSLSSNQVEEYDEYFIKVDGTRLPEDCPPELVWAAIFEVKRKGYKLKKFAFTQDDRHTLGVAAIWKSFTKIMMKRKARAIGLKDVLPDVLMGIQIAEYDHHLYMDDKAEKNATGITSKKEQEENRASSITAQYSAVPPVSLDQDPNDTDY